MKVYHALIVIWSIFLAAMIILFCMMFPNCAYADIKDEDAVRAIIGESACEGIEGMRTVASAIRNRGHLRGVYGLKAKRVDIEPAWVWKLARQAWEDSKHFDYADGADHWEGVSFKDSYWAKNMTFVKKVCKTNYYKAR